MGDLLEFVIRVTDLGSVAKFTSNAIRGFSAVENSVGRAQSKMKGASGSIAEMNTRLEQLTRRRDLSINTRDVARANREIQGLERNIQRLQGAGVNQSSGGMRMPMWMKTGAIAAGIMAGGVGIAKAGANAQQDIIGLTTFLGKQQAQNVYGQIQQDAAATPFGTKALLSVDRALISAGVSAKNARLDMLALANAISATGGGDAELSRMATNMQQIKNAGVANREDIKQFSFNGINIYGMLAAATGKTAAETQKMAVSYDLLSYALRKASAQGGMYAGAMAAQSESISGKWSTLVDNIEIAAAKIGMSQAGGITGLIDVFIEKTKSLPAIVATWTPMITSVVSGITSFVGSLMNLAKWLYQNWSWIKYFVSIALVFKTAMVLAAGATAVYNSVMAIASMRLGMAMTAQLGLNAAMAAMPWGWILAGLTLLGVGIAAWASKTKATVDMTAKTMPESMAANLTSTDALATIADAGKKGGNAYFGAFNLQKKVAVGAYGEGYKNPLAGGHFVQDTSTFNLVTVLRNFNDTVGRQVKVFSGKKIYVPGADDGGPSYPGLMRLAKTASIKSFASKFSFAQPDRVPGMPDFNAAGGDIGNSIVGGGKRTININFKSFVERMENHFGSKEQGMQFMEDEFRDMLARVLAGIPRI